MAPKTRLLTRQWYRSWLFWGLFLLLDYTLLGFFAVPVGVREGLETGVRDTLGWSAQVEDVRFNPFTINLEVDGLAVADAEQRTVVSAGLLRVDFSLASVLHRAWSFDALLLEKPFVQVDLLANGQNNFSRALEQQAARTTAAASSTNETADAETEAATSGSGALLPRLRVDAFAIRDGRVRLDDFSTGEQVTHDLNPLHLSLEQFTTYFDKDDPYEIQISLGDGQEIAWRGTINTAASQSAGTLEIRQLDLPYLWQYAHSQVPYVLQSGRFDLSLSYDLAFGGESPVLRVRDGRAELQQLALATAADPVPFLTLPSLQVDDVATGWPELDTRVASVTMQQPVLRVSRQSDGRLALPPAAPSESAESDETSPSPDSVSEAEDDEAPALRWAVGEIVLNQGRVLWVDAALAEPVSLAVSEIQVALRDLSQDLQQAWPFEVQFTLQDSAASRIAGTLIPADGALEASVSLTELSLPLLQPYLQTQVDAELASGRFTLDGTLRWPALDSGQRRFEGSVRLDELLLKDTHRAEPLLAWEALALAPVVVDLQPLRVQAGELKLTKPDARLRVESDGRSNLARVLRQAPAASAEAVASTTPAPPEGGETAAGTAGEVDAASPRPEIHLDAFTLEGGAFRFVDQSLQPAFDLQVSQFGGQVRNLSSQLNDRSQVDLEGLVDDYARLRIAGAINPLSEPIYSDLTLTMDNFELTGVSPYTVKFLGNPVEKGKLTLDLAYHIEQERLTASNRVVIDQFTLGPDQPSPDATDLPVELAIALLEDSAGRITIDLPLEGRRDDPQFSLGGLLLQALTNLITSATTAPFSLLGSLVAEGDSLEEVWFTPGASSLDETQQRKLEELSGALRERPGLALEIRGISHQLADTEALKREQLQRRLEAQRQKKALEEAALLADLLNQLGGADAVAAVQSASGGAAPSVEVWREAVLDRLPVADAELRRLAADRAGAIRRQLVEQAGLAPGRVFVLDPRIEREGPADHVVVRFTLKPG